MSKKNSCPTLNRWLVERVLGCCVGQMTEIGVMDPELFYYLLYMRYDLVLAPPRRYP